MTLRLHLQCATKEQRLPTRAQFQRWVLATLASARVLPKDGEISPMAPAVDELTIRLVDEAESTELNSTYRHKQGPTNVLSFPFTPPPELPTFAYLGDLVICAPLVWQEADNQGKQGLAHFAHLTTHGVLHLLGYDHETPNEATVMETLETAILNQLGIADPYE